MSETARTEKNSSKNIYGDPPKISISLPGISELTQNSKRWRDVQLPIDILLLTVKDCEFLSCYHYVVDPFRSYFKGLGHVYFGSIGEDQDVKLKVALMKCSEGSKVPGGALTVVKNAVTQLRPKAVFSVGHCGGMSQETTKLGDVVVSEKLTTYSYQKVTQDGKKFRGLTTPVSRDIAELIKCAGYGWNPPLENPNKGTVEVHCGEVLSGCELVQAEWRREELVKSFPEAIAIETEGEGVFSAAHELKMEWVVIKGISGYADGTEAKETWQTFASVTAASLVVSILKECSIFEDWPHYKDNSTDRQHSALSKEVPVEPCCSSAQSSQQQHVSSTKTADGSTRHLPPPKVKCRYEESSPSGALTPKKRDSSVTEFWEWCRNQLRAFYNTMCQVKVTPWDPDNTVHINSIYIQVTFLQDHRKPDGTTKKKLGDSSEVFEGDEDHPIRRRILVYGRPGIGKSTFTQKVALDWANGRTKILEKYNLLLLIRLRDVCGISDLCTMLKTAELLSADDPMAVNNLCEYVRQNQEKVLLILDGYDEYSGGKSSLIHEIWRGSQLRDCCVMITTRPVKEDELRVPSHAQFELNGFDSWEQKKQFANKILPDEEDVEGLLEYLRKHDLVKMAEIPLLLLMLCLLWKKKKPQLPTSRAEIYVEFIQTLLDHMAIKDSDNVATDKSIDEYQEELSKIGKLAFDALLEDCLYFNFSKFPKGDLFEKLIHVGFFQVSKLSALNREKIVYFLHKSVQEFLAAWFIVQEVKVKKNETVTCLSGMDTFEKSKKMDEVLKFVCELSSDAVGIVFDHLHYVGKKQGLTNYNFTRTPSVQDLSRAQKEFILFCVDYLFRCPASDRLAVYSAFLSCVNHVVMLNDEHVSTAAEKNFFKGTASFPNYLFFEVRTTFEVRNSRESILSILSDLNAVVLTCSGEVQDFKKYADLRDANLFLKKSEKKNFIYLRRITDAVFCSKLLPELISAPVCSSQSPVDNLGENEDNNVALSLIKNRSDQAQQHCLSLVREVELKKVTVEDFVLLKNLLPLLTAPRDIDIKRSVTDALLPLLTALRDIDIKRSLTDVLEGNSIENAIHRINFTDNLHILKLVNMNLTAKCAAFIAESLHHSPNLHELCLSCNPLHSCVSHLAKNLHHTPRLTILELACVEMGEKECAALAASLQYLNKLERLNMSYNALGHGIIELAKNLNSVPNLTWLDLSCTKIGEDEASALARALKDVPELSDLDMAFNALGHGIIELAKNLNSVPNLTKLNLLDTNMGEDEASALARALKDVPELSNLFLGWNPLGRGVRDLVQHLSSVPKLKDLILKCVQMTKTETEELCTAVNGRNIILSTDYQEGEVKGGRWIDRRLTKAELKKRGIRFRREQDGDDDDDDDNDDDDDEEEDSDDFDDDDEAD
ncbi:NLR family CARD domain-containing protein 4-like [Pocillopora verrucosa]|uniref:NLR family CARD domain-containing protein 4-like n=1 Tax=Pocillopora verrucosa TaxID=203993 RepID=UPI00333EC352